MFVFLSKLLPLFVYPLGLVCVLLVVALVIRSRRRRWLILAALALLWLGGNRWVSSVLVRSLEWRYLPTAPLPSAQAIVLLGGGTRPQALPRPLAEVNEAGDRLFYAAWLYRQGKAPLVLVTGGGIEWRGPRLPETEAMRDLLVFMGVPTEAILLESEARNTYENALYTRQILAAQGIDRILLVTSALHMPRSVRLFERQGFTVIPAPADFLVSQADWAALTHPDPRQQVIQLFPDAEALYYTTLALKEYIGMVIYGLRGWL